MHYYTRLLQWFPFLPLLAHGDIVPVPPGFLRVVTLRGNFVVTSRSSFLIAKDYT
jgi:hypothetical protein